jgi:Fe-S-cluster containining protein
VKCCDGTLTANIHGIEMGGPSHKACHLVDLSNKKCADYKGRPQLCRDFKCEWLVNEDIPISLKPSLTDNTIVRFSAEGMSYLFIAHKNNKPNDELLLWMVEYCQTKEMNLAWWENGKLKLRGSKEWVRVMKYTHSKI